MLHQELVNPPFPYDTYLSIIYESHPSHHGGDSKCNFDPVVSGTLGGSPGLQQDLQVSPLFPVKQLVPIDIRFQTARRFRIASRVDSVASGTFGRAQGQSSWEGGAEGAVHQRRKEKNTNEVCLFSASHFVRNASAGSGLSNLSPNDISVIYSM